jgi:K+-sensing histidine kinase KdpD
MNDPGFDRILRHALQTELSMRLRPKLLHELKGPVQIILSALHLLQKKAAAGETQELEKYGNWIKDAAHDLIERAQTVLPQQTSHEAPVATCDLHALTDEAVHLLRDEAALKEVEFLLEERSGACMVRGHAADLKLALQAILFGALDIVPPHTAPKILIQQTDGPTTWSMDIEHGNKPTAEIFELRYYVQPPHSGIGWPVARAIVQESSGRFSLEDRAGGGWQIKLVLPAPRA